MKRIFTAFMMMLCTACVASAANYLTFTAEEDGSTFGIVCGNKKPNLQYSLDGGETWTALAEGDTVILAHKGDHALLRGDNPEGLSSSWNQCSTFTMTEKVAASGSVMSLIDGTGLSTEIPKENCFNSLFKGCASLTQAPELPATTLTENCYRAIFSGCTSLTQAPALPAMTLADRCYYDMFYGCTRLTQAPELPATTLKENCYLEMFAKCTSLTQAPELPAMTLDGGCYAAMFSDCTGLTQAPALPATTLTYMCYYGMFSGCTSLTQAPALPATTLPGYCYVRMFINCTSLEQAPELPATTLAEGCYESMFANCISLTKAPALPATQLAKTACDGMFSGCTNLSEINVSFIGWASGSRTSGWVKNVAPTGTFICPYILALEYGESRIPEGWTVKYVGDTTSVEPNYLTFTAEEDGSSFGIVNKKNSVDMRYSLDGGETWTALEEGNTVVLAKKGDKALFKGRNGDGLGSLGDDYVHFVMTGAIAASGSVMSLIDGIGLYEGITEIECFRGLFSDCASLTQAPELPATTLANYCYFKMFSGCTSLTQAPELPATILADCCYYGMFSGCTSLTQAPALPATTVVNDCYERMFYGCTSLTQAPELPAMTLAANCYYDMFSGCTSLTQAPALPATTLALACYANMFEGCTNLSEIHVSFVNWSDAEDCTSLWTQNVAPAGTFVCPKTLALEYGESRIPEGWTVKYYVEGETNYLTFTAEEDNVSVTVTEGEAGGGDIQPAPYSQRSDESAVASVGGEKRPLMRRNLPSTGVDLKYSTDGGETWTEMVPGTPVTLAKKGDKILFKGNNPSGFSTETQRIQFDIEGTASASGSVMSLIDEVGEITVIPNEYCFANLFENCAGLTEMPDLSATELKAYCYKDMFRGCTSLTSTSMLPATTLEEGSYEGMFYDCGNLSEVSVSFSDWADGTEDWLHGVAPEGRVISPANLAPTVGDDYVPDGWAIVPDSILTDVSEALAVNITVWTDDLTIFVRGAEGEVSLYDMSGRIVAASNSTDEERALSVPAKGVYVVRTSDGEKSVLVR